LFEKLGVKVPKIEKVSDMTYMDDYAEIERKQNI
jgi:hypothetical protein